MPGRPRSERKHGDILDAAFAEFTNNGFAGTNMDTVSDRAAVSKRTVYNHFESKERLFEAVSLRVLEQVPTPRDVEFDSRRSLPDQLQEIGGEVVAMLASEAFIRLARLALAESTRAPSAAGALFVEMQEREAVAERWIGAAARAGRLRVPDPFIAAQHFTALVKAFVFWPRLFAGVTPPGERERELIVNSAVVVFLDHYSRRDD